MSSLISVTRSLSQRAIERCSRRQLAPNSTERGLIPTMECKRKSLFSSYIHTTFRVSQMTSEREMSFFDSLLDGIRAMFETTRSPEMAASSRLGASSVGELAGALDELRNGEQGWVRFDDYGRLFAAKDGGRERRGRSGRLCSCRIRRRPSMLPTKGIGGAAHLLFETGVRLKFESDSVKKAAN